MKIKNVRSSANAAALPPALDENRALSGSSGSFQRHFNAHSHAQQEQYALELTKKIDEQGDLLKQRADIYELQRYRELVAEFISSVINGAFHFATQDVYDMRGRRKVFSTIDRINERLEELAVEVLKQQQDNIAIVHMVDDIRGLIVDMML